MYCRIHLHIVTDVFRRLVLPLPTGMMIKDHYVSQENDEVEYLLLFPLHPQVVIYYFV